MPGVIGASLSFRDGDRHGSAPAARACQLNWGHAGGPSPDLHLHESRDVAVAETGAPRILPPVAPGLAVRWTRIALDAVEEDLVGDPDPGEDHRPRQSPGPKIDDGLGRPSALVGEEEHHRQ